MVGCAAELFWVGKHYHHEDIRKYAQDVSNPAIGGIAKGQIVGKFDALADIPV
jgi:tRNA U34 5-carboxymethylaminomethyl modifying enzyme MnmG/GidA